MPSRKPPWSATAAGLQPRRNGRSSDRGIARKQARESRTLKASQYSYLKAAARRLAAGIPVFLVVTFAATALSSLAPGSAAQLILGENATPEQIATLNAQFGYDLPVMERYLLWLGRLLRGD